MVYSCEEVSYAQLDAELAAWRQQWPLFCRACRGWGGFVTYQSHPYGMGSATEQLTEPCEALAPGVCHRCGAPDALCSVDSDDGPCLYCGWNYDDGEPQY